MCDTWVHVRRYLSSAMLGSRSIRRRAVPLRGRLERPRVRCARERVPRGGLRRSGAVRARLLPLQTRLEGRRVRGARLRGPDVLRPRCVRAGPVLLQGRLAGRSMSSHRRAGAQVPAELRQPRRVRSRGRQVRLPSSLDRRGLLTTYVDCKLLPSKTIVL